MTTREQNARTVWEAIEDLLTGKEELSHMSGDFELCGKTADDVIRKINEDRRNEDGNK